jgi:predicted nucleotidyltransferase
MTKLKGSLLDRRPGQRPSRDSEAGRRLPKGTKSIQASILQALKYSDHFGFPLTIEEICIRYVGANPCIRPQILKTIQALVKSNQIEQSGDYYYLPGQKSLVARRLKHAKLSVPQLARAKNIASKLSHVPGVLAIYLTGSLAMSNSGLGSDVDFMVIAKDGLLWTTRFLLTLYTEFLGFRRRPHDPHTSGKACLNLYLTPITYNLPPSKRSLYTAYELIQAVPLYDPEGTHSSLLAANSWIKNYLPNAIKRSDLLPRTLLKRNSRLQAEKGPAGTSSVIALEKWLQKRSVLGGQHGRRVLMGTIESICYHLQLLYMRPKLTREYITKDSAFFHPNDPAPKV